jgi:hypothetical protein
MGSDTDNRSTRSREPGRKGPRDSRPPRGRDAARRSTSPRRMGPARPVRPEEALDPLDSSTRDVDSYGRTFRLFLEDGLDSLPAHAGGVTLAYSRAALRTYDTTALAPHKAEEVRLDVLTAVCEERGLDRARGALSRDVFESEVRDQREAVRVPRPRGVERFRPRNSGTRPGKR